jgi:sensor histidine kinase regulating citrate/malate metabolism
MHIPRTMFQVWILIAVAVTLLCGTLYTGIQHQERTGANDPQIQLAQDIASNPTTPASEAIPTAKVDVTKSLANFAVVYDDQSKVVVSSMDLHGQTPTIPQGVLDYTKAHGEDRLTWQPEKGVRLAIVVTKITGNGSGFVLVGRSLKEVESRLVDLEVGIAAGWLVTLLITFAVAYLLTVKRAALQEPPSLP